MHTPSLLYLDDERINLLAFKSQFRRNYEVHCAATVEDAIGILTTTRIDVVFSDQRMPDLCGTEFLQQAQQLQPQAMRVIISGYANDKRIAEAYGQSIVDAVFEKPYRSAAIMQFIQEHITRLSAEEQKS